MAECKYCSWCEPEYVPEHTSWEKPTWICAVKHTVRAGEHDCPDFSREPGSDDDLGET